MTFCILCGNEFEQEYVFDDTCDDCYAKNATVSDDMSEYDYDGRED